jgi:hypothetical protein
MSHNGAGRGPRGPEGPWSARSAVFSIVGCTENGVQEIPLDALAELVAEKLRGTGSSDLVDAATVAKALGISRDTVYSRAEELGGRQIGNGPRPRWRFDLAVAIATWEPSAPTRVTPRRRRSQNDRDLLPVRGES